MAPAATAKKPAKILGTFAPSTREELERKRDGVVAVMPSGERFRIRAVPLLRHALSGGLPQRLRQMALEGNRGLTKILSGGDDEVTADGTALLDYMDDVVLASVVEPELTKDDLRSSGLNEQPLIHPRDYAWLYAVANGDEDRDAQGRLLWGEPPLDLVKVFAGPHDCPEDCEACAEAFGALRAQP